MIPTTEADLDRLIENQRLSVNKEASLPSTTVAKQILIYLVSFFLPPFGLGWGFKYLKSKDEKAQKIGLIAILLTIISLILTFWITKNFVNNITKSINSELNLDDFNY